MIITHMSPFGRGLNPERPSIVRSANVIMDVLKGRVEGLNQP